MGTWLKLNHLRKLFSGDLDIDPLKLTIVQSLLVAFIASVLAIGLYEFIGHAYSGLWYQLGTTLFVALLLAPIFLYPTFRTTRMLREAKRQIEANATTDHLTGLPNLLALSMRIEEALTAMPAGKPFAIHFVDLDRFKQVNDRLGHDAGNAVLVEAARRLTGTIGLHGFAARYGGDEFVILQFETKDETDARQFALDLRTALIASYAFHGGKVNIGATVGTAIAGIHGETQQQLLKSADLALYYAKEHGMGQRMFNHDLAEEAEHRQRVEEALRNALATETVTVHFQSIVRLENPLDINGFEALARIEDITGKILDAEDFIHVAESSGLIVEIGEEVLKQACKECVKWHPDLYVAVNVSPAQFLRSDFVKTVQKALDASGLAPQRLELEITESVLINEIAYVTPALRHLREMGVRVALDNFGSGFSSLHYLRQFEIDKIKVDKSIIEDAGHVHVANNILRSIATIADEMKLTVTAEGVDTIAKAEFLAEEKCVHELQGYLFSRPVSARRAFMMQEFVGREGEDLFGAQPEGSDGADSSVVSLSGFKQGHALKH